MRRVCGLFGPSRHIYKHSALHTSTHLEIHWLVLMKTRILSVSIAAILATAAHAADRPQSQVEEVTVFGERISSTLTATASTGSRLGITPLETPASIEIIDGELIRQRGDATIVEAITRATGLSNDASPGDGGSSMAARGFVGHNSVMQLYDGTRLFIGAGTVTFPFDTWMAERIEVLRGPASVMYGQGAIGAAINVVPRQPTLEGQEGELLVGAGTDGRLNAAVDFNAPIGSTMAYRLDASYREADNWVDRGDSDSLTLSANFLWQPAENLSVTLSADYGDRTDMQYWGTPLRDGRIDASLREINYNVRDSDVHYEDASTRLRAEWEISEGVVLTNTAYYLDTERHWRNLEAYSLDDATETVQRADYLEIYHHQEQIGDQFTASFSQDFGGRSNTIVVGFDINQIDFQHSNNSPYGGSSVVPVRGFEPGLFLNLAGTYPKYSTDTEHYAVFFEDRFELNDQWSLIGGARYDNNDYERTNLLTGARFGGDFSDTTWRVGAVFQPIETLSFYAQYATAVDPIGSLLSLNATQADLELTTGKQLEVGVKQQALSGRLEWTLALFDIVKEDLITDDPNIPGPDATQVGEQSSRGVEASVAFTINDQWRIDANVAVLDAEYEEYAENTGNTPPSIPERLANLWVSWEFIEDWRARAGVRHVAKRYLDEENTAELPDYTILDAAVDWAVIEDLTISAHVRNASDKTYALAAYSGSAIFGMPRTWELQARYQF
jgi:iron complex outermembrane recepter protein